MESTSLVCLSCSADALAVWRAYLGALSDRDLSVFATFDHKQNAQDSDLTMPESKVIVFGNPAAGTPLMLQAPTLALDLPLKVLIRETELGCEVVYTHPSALAERHGLAPETEGIVMMGKLLADLAKQACNDAREE
ncbi:DUF302 domain-containing protein [Oleidesulfovibrio sp.]|uniref:DUF302 domain-containing protein n=1 Tax=Oleidesulfovibrio sp. TaxID=2909707 RepID=UPI003A86711B